jgi:hypothetical protein
MNEWRGMINRAVVQICSLCQSGTREFVLHCFWKCEGAKKAWYWGMHIMQRLAPRRRPTTPFTWKQGIFSHRIPRPFKEVSRVWLLLKGVILWMLWLWKLDKV